MRVASGTCGTVVLSGLANFEGDDQASNLVQCCLFYERFINQQRMCAIKKIREKTSCDLSTDGFK
jgi:hypothetical protein